MLIQTSSQLDLLLGPSALTAFLLIAVVWGGIKRWWVFGWAYEELKQERDEWKMLAKTGTMVAEAGVRTVEHVVGKTAEEIADE